MVEEMKDLENAVRSRCCERNSISCVYVCVFLGQGDRGEG